MGNLTVQKGKVSFQPQTLRPAKQPTPEQARAAQPSPSSQASPTTQSGSASVAQRLKELEDLYKKGLISKKEYDQKRAEILKGF